MNSKTFDEFILKPALARDEKVLGAKAGEYASEGSRFHNFERAAAMLGCHRLQALRGMWVKHLISVFDMIDGAASGKTYSAEYIEEKCGDTRNYTTLLEGMLKEESFLTQDY